jgi:uncharacterized membrane protein YozB (DUF420 family)
MSGIPAFSMFSAVSELFVTAGVLYIMRRNWTRRTFSVAVFLVVALFEAFVNVMYMSTRAARASAGTEPVAAGLKMFFAVHGMLSLIAYLGFVVLAVFAVQEQKQGRYFFRDHPALTWTFLALWIVSVGSGEVLFVLRYFA